MRSYDEYKQILELWELGMNKLAISRQTDIPRRTIIDCIQRYGTVEQLNQQSEQSIQPILLKILRGEIDGAHQILLESYAYLLGLYLGDGNIVKARNIYRLRVTLDAKYPNIVQSCANTMQRLFPENQIGVIETEYQGHPSYVNVSLYYKYLPEMFPQHGEGLKHSRTIQLEAWQDSIVVETYPLKFFRGLYHSDGSRSSNVINGKDYPRYQFTNTSAHIAALFSLTCDRLGLHWTSKSFQVPHNYMRYDIIIAKRKDVEFLDSVIGAKS